MGLYMKWQRESKTALLKDIITILIEAFFHLIICLYSSHIDPHFQLLTCDKVIHLKIISEQGNEVIKFSVRELV